LEEIILPSLFGILLALTIILIYLLIENEIRIDIKEVLRSFAQESTDTLTNITEIEVDKILGKFLISKEEIPPKTAESLATFGFLNFNLKDNYYIVKADEESIKRVKRALKIINYQIELLKREEHVWIEPKEILRLGLRNLVILEVENIIKVKLFIFPTEFVIELFRNRDLRKKLLIISEHSKRIVLESGVLIAIKRLTKEIMVEEEKIKRTYIILAEVISDSKLVDALLNNLADNLKEEEKIDKESFVRALKKAIRRV